MAVFLVELIALGYKAGADGRPTLMGPLAVVPNDGGHGIHGGTLEVHLEVLATLPRLLVVLFEEVGSLSVEALA